MRKLIQQYAKDLTAGRLASGYEHSYRVYHLAREIGEDMEYDDDILYAACFLHDIDMTSLDSQPSAAKAEAILRETGFGSVKVQHVCDAILNHLPCQGTLETVEAKLLHDANLLDSLGAIGMSRLSIGSFLWQHSKSMEQVLEFLREWLGYAENLCFAESRRLAKEKINFMRSAVDQFAVEMNL